MTTLEWFLIIGLSLYLMVCIAGAWALMYLVDLVIKGVIDRHRNPPGP